MLVSLSALPAVALYKVHFLMLLFIQHTIFLPTYPIQGCGRLEPVAAVIG